MKLPSLSGKKVLITGGLGFIGSNLAIECLESGAEVTVFDVLDPRCGGNLYNLESVKDDIRFEFHDIKNFDQVTRTITDKDILFNCAASTSHPFSMREPWLDQDVNSTGTINLLEACRRFRPSIRLIHAGTTTQLGPLQYTPADEMHPEFPIDIYSANKTVSEKFVLIYSRSHNLNASVVRLSNTFGPRASIHSPEFTFNNYFVGLALQGKAITIYGEGEQLRNAIYVGDAVSAMIRLALEKDNACGETFLVVNDEHHSVAEIASKTAEIIGGKTVHVPWPEDRERMEVGDAVYTNSKIKKCIDWMPETSLEAGLSLTKSYYENCLNEYLR